MESQNMPVHYLTEKIDIYNEYCNNKEKCLTIIYANIDNYTINGNFLEKHLTLLLKLKQVISEAGVSLDNINNIFYNIDYITYICVGHGVSFFKHFLYATNNWYGWKIFDKILSPPSTKLISIIKKYGWKDKNIIKINLPRWDKYNNQYLNYCDNCNIKNNSIFIMFTWRSFKKGKIISDDYFKNIINLINNDKLFFVLNSNKIILYFTLHHKLNKYKNRFRTNKYIQFIEEINISEVISKTNLLITDFSSIIFDIIYRRKPFIIYIPDANDPKIEITYQRNYYELIQSLKNGTIFFENKYFNYIEVINKIFYYIKNNFNLEPKLEKFYDCFEIKKGNNTKEFINYITNANHFY
jgi:CDP-glycerol glycerophosphotransferase (TagB/SpsB family)